MPEVRVQHLGDVRFEIEARGHKIISDQPVDGGGRNAGMTPQEFLLAALGSCAGHYAADFLKRHHLATAGTEIVVTAEKVAMPPRLDRFRISILTPAIMTRAQQIGLRRAVENCMVQNTLIHPSSIELVLEEAGPIGIAASA
jgi:uncharacterized OsmC-like protein